MHKAKAALRAREHARARAGVDACALAQVSLSLDETQPVQRVAINRRTSSIGIRSVAPGFTPVAIREVLFEGEVS